MMHQGPAGEFVRHEKEEKRNMTSVVQRSETQAEAGNANVHLYSTD